MPLGEVREFWWGTTGWWGWDQIRATPVCWARQKIRTSPNLSILHTLKPSFERTRMRRSGCYGPIFWPTIKRFSWVVFMRLGGVTVCRCGCQGGKVGARDRQKMAYYCLRGPWGQARVVSDVAIKVTIGWHGMPAYSPILLLTVEDCRPLLLLLLVQTVWFRLLPPRHRDATGLLRFIQYCP